MNWRPILVLALVIGAALAGWALWTHRMPPSTVAAAGDRPDYRLDDFELVSLDAAGRESFTLRAPTLVRSPGDRTMSLTTPVFFVPNGEGKHWEIRSRSGWVSADQTEIRLQGEVKANGPDDDVRPVTMNTDHLSVYPRQNRASTDAVVTIVQPGSILRGRGFAVSTLTKRYVLRSEVQSTHAPSSH